MKKIFSFMVVAMVALLPVVTNAAEEYYPSCGNQDAEGNITCVVAYNFTNGSSAENLSVTLTEEGGAEILNVFEAADSDWNLVNPAEEVDGVWTVMLTSPGSTDEGNLFSFKYKPSGHTDCKVKLSVNDVQMNITPPTPNADDKTPNKQTGATLPYIALGAIIVLATGAYIATRNKSKMYKI